MTEEQARRYHAAMHAVQSGVMMELELDPKGGTPKHLRVGVNSALCEHAALARLLIAKGIITEYEYYEAIIAEAEAEQARYEKRLSQHYGKRVRLA